MNNNALWRLDTDNLAAYTEDREVMRKIRRSYPDFVPMATYEKDGVIFGRQYRVPSARKRSARHLLGVNVQSA
ncbi:hypothetical protein [Paenibacillus lautus]|uniref:hypothetical protein n=1 Tax=Paenibacillus lautus TaxID=1401 RepID=UPI002DB7226E|nr:hypothetical protein [Paenibacillus lautus]MEC0253619.1 hypothetical protein [Paenibacillus lautus]